MGCRSVSTESSGSVDELRISPLDHGLLVGDGVFETLRVYGGVPFAWTPPPPAARPVGGRARSRDPAGRRRCARSPTRCSRPTTSPRRACASRSPADPRRSARSAASVPPTVVVAASALTPWPPTADVVTVPWPRNEHGATAGLKTISYAENVRALAYAHEHGAGEAIFAEHARRPLRGHRLERLPRGGRRARAPRPRAPGCLLGVTRALVLELAEQLGIDAMEADRPVDASRPPTRRSSRRPRARCRPSPTSTAPRSPSPPAS